MMNYIEEYDKAIKTGKVTVSQKVAKVYDQLVKDMHNVALVWEYSDRHAEHAIFFIQNYCKHSKGKMGGKPFLLELWQLALVAATFGFIHKIDQVRRFREVLLIVARKNGKSTLAAAIGLYLMIADQEPGAEIYAVATKKDQAKVIWSEARRMVGKAPILKRKIRCVVSEMTSAFNDGSFRPLGSDSDTQDGLNVHGALLDEIHAWKDKNLYDVIVDGTSVREQPLTFITSTAGTVRESVFDMKYDECTWILNGYGDAVGYHDDRVLPVIYELDKRDEWTDEKAWAKANPGLGTIKSITTLKGKVHKAQQNQLLVKNLLTKDFNVRETSSSVWMSFEQLNNEAIFDMKELKPSYAIAGADLSGAVDLTCGTVIFKVPGDETVYVRQMYFLPEDLLEKRVREDKIPYDLWKEMGYLRTTPGNKVDYKFLTQWFVELREEYDLYVVYGGYDAWSAKYWVDEMTDNFGDIMEPVYQGKKTLSAPMKALGADLDANRINYGNNPILKWCMSNVAVDVDKNDNIQPIKTDNQRRRIDGFASLLDAYVALERHRTDYENMI